MAHDICTTDPARLLEQIREEEKVKARTKPKVKPPTTLDKIFHCANTNKPITHYFSTGRQIDEGVLKAIESKKTGYTLPPVPLTGISYKLLEQARKKEIRDKEAKLKVYEKPSRRTRDMQNINERLYVPSVPAAVSKKKQTYELDPQYFSVVKGRPIKDGFSLRHYVHDLREIVLTKLKTGFLRDEMHLIDEQFRNEQKIINRIIEQHKNYYASFKEFEAQDHEEWLNIRKYGEEMAAKTKIMKSEFKKLMRELSALRCSLYVLEEQWRNSKICQIFLYQISPLSWREEHRIQMRESTDDIDAEKLDVSDMINRYKLGSEGSVASLMSLIKIFEEDIAIDQGPPQLYFTEPWQVRIVFRELELQHLSSLLIIEAIKKPKDIMAHGLEVVSKYYDDEIKKIQEQLVGIEEMINIEEEKTKTIEKATKDLINTDLKELVSSETAILAHVYVEHAYEECVAAGDTDMTTLETLQALKQLHEDLMMKLDSLPADIVRQAMVTVRNRNTRALEKAHYARRQVAMLDNLTKSMKRALEKPFVKKGKPVMWRSKPFEKVKKVTKAAEEYTEQEMDFLTFFTDYCQFDDEDAKLFLTLSK